MRDFLEIRQLKAMLEKMGIPYEHEELEDNGMIIYYPSKEHCVCEVESSEKSHGGKFDTLQIIGLITPEEECSSYHFCKDFSMGWLSADTVIKKICQHRHMMLEAKGIIESWQD